MQIDLILYHRTMHLFSVGPCANLVTDVKVIPGEEVALQYLLLVCDMKIDATKIQAQVHPSP